MKKILKFFLFFVVICVACFCEIGGRVIAQSDSSKLRIAFVPQLIGIPYFTAMEDGGMKAAEDLDVEFLYTGATQASAAEQVKILDSLIRQGINAIAISTLNSAVDRKSVV